MKSALVLFGSSSDVYIYKDLITELKKSFEVDFEVISAHRDPERLKTRLDEDNFDFIVAGAGLAAHLPGVCASLTNKPVFGVPVAANFGGLDSLLSILQMPFGVPVGTLSSNSISCLSKLMSTLETMNSRKINIVVNNEILNHEHSIQEIARLEKFATEEGFTLEKSTSVSEKLMNIVLVSTDYQHKVDSNAVYIPLMNTSDKNNPTSSLKTMDLIEQGGVWFGVNNSRNAIKFLSKII